MIRLFERLGWSVVLILLVGVGVARAQSNRSGSQDEDSSREKARCASLPEEKRRRQEQCKTDEERREDAYQRRVKEREDREKPKHSSFFHWLHLDGLWVPASTGVSSLGLIGTHMTIADIHGANVFGPPGVMLLLDDGEDGPRIRPALTWGVSIHLFDFRTPGSDRDAQLYINITKCWTMGSYRDGIDMAGLSVTWKK